MFGYLKLLVPNGEGEKTNVSVGYLGCGTELQLHHSRKIEDVSVLVSYFQYCLVS